MRRYRLNSSLDLLQKIYTLGFCILFGSLVYYQVFKGDYYLKRAKNNYLRVIPLKAIRGSIYDCQGQVIAYDKAVFNISVIPYQVKGRRDSLFAEIAKNLDIDPALIHKNYKNNFRSHFSPVNIVTNIDKSTVLELKEKFKDEVLVNTAPNRFYPYPYLFAHLTGYVQQAGSLYDKLKKYGYHPLERVGVSGLEQYYNAYLKGEDGGDLIEVDAKARVVGFLGRRLPKKGQDIFLSLDMRIQKLCRQAMAGRSGVFILMNSDSGEIISLYSSPSFNPNYFIDGKNLSQVLKNRRRPLLNRAIQSNYPIGSIFKPLLAAGALTDNEVKASTVYECNGSLNLGLSSFRCNGNHGKEDLYDALAHSCNVYFYNLGLASGANKISAWAGDFGLGTPTGIDLPYEKAGLVPSPKWKKAKFKKNWYAGDTVNFSIGQGFLEATPLQTLVAINVFANGGYLVKPYSLKRVGSVVANPSVRSYVGISEKDLNVVKRGLRRAVSDNNGTARLLQKLDFPISGKTGTAQTKGSSHGWFVGFFTLNEKTYSICVFLENGGSSYEAVKVTREFLIKMRKQELL